MPYVDLKYLTLSSLCIFLWQQSLLVKMSVGNDELNEQSLESVN